MEYILNSETLGIDFDRYKRYVDSIRDKLPPHIYAFAANTEHFNLTSHSSLHDSWIERLTMKETPNVAADRTLDIDLRLLGPFHDRRIHLRYTDVSQYSLSAPPKYEEPRFRSVWHGDLITHEIRLGHNGRFVHELLFARAATFLIECSDIRHSEELI
jgi:hypothetical protein